MNPLKFIVATLHLSLLWHWYDHLWLPHLTLQYWAQIIPISATHLILSLMFGSSSVKWLLQVPMVLLLIASIILQTLVWISLVHLPLY